MAQALGKGRAVTLLDQNLAEEKEALREVERIATRVGNESMRQTVGAYVRTTERRTKRGPVP
jgi:ferritin-like metal-binding protein YciE